MSTHASEVESGERFEFGRNWSRFLQVLNEDRIRARSNRCGVFWKSRICAAVAFSISDRAADYSAWRPAGWRPGCIRSTSIRTR